MSNVNRTCWICGGQGDSREHTIKRSDLKAIFGDATPENPIFLHLPEEKNIRISSLDDTRLKSSAKICRKCNNNLTQKHDRAWEKLSNALRLRLSENPSAISLDLNSVWPGNFKKQAGKAHLYLTKIFADGLVQWGVPIDISKFGQAILNNDPHHRLLIRVSPAAPQLNRNSVLSGPIDSMHDNVTGACVCVAYEITVPPLSVQILWLADGYYLNIDGWHPGSELREMPIYPKVNLPDAELNLIREIET